MSLLKIVLLTVCVAVSSQAIAVDKISSGANVEDFKHLLLKPPRSPFGPSYRAVYTLSENWCAKSVSIRVDANGRRSPLQYWTLDKYTFPNPVQDRGRALLNSFAEIIRKECRKVKEIYLITTKDDPNQSYDADQIILFQGYAAKSTLWAFEPIEQSIPEYVEGLDTELVSDFRANPILPDGRGNWCGKSSVFGENVSMRPTRDTYFRALQYNTQIESMLQYFTSRRDYLKNLRKKYSRKVAGRGKYEKNRIKQTKKWFSTMENVPDLAEEELSLVLRDYQSVLRKLFNEMNASVAVIRPENVVSITRSSRQTLKEIKECLSTDFREEGYRKLRGAAFTGMPLEANLFSSIQAHMEKRKSDYIDIFSSHLQLQYSDIEVDAAWYIMGKVYGPMFIGTDAELAYLQQKTAIREGTTVVALLEQEIAKGEKELQDMRDQIQSIQKVIYATRVNGWGISAGSRPGNFQILKNTAVNDVIVQTRLTCGNPNMDRLSFIHMSVSVHGDNDTEEADKYRWVGGHSRDLVELDVTSSSGSYQLYGMTRHNSTSVFFNQMLFDFIKNERSNLQAEVEAKGPLRKGSWRWLWSVNNVNSRISANRMAYIDDVIKEKTFKIKVKVLLGDEWLKVDLGDFGSGTEGGLADFAKACGFHFRS